MPTVTDGDRRILQDLGRKLAEVAALPVQREKAELWRRLNALDSVRPMVWMNQFPWEELAGQELRLRTEDEWCRWMERCLRRELYRWRHFPVDHTVMARLPQLLVVDSTGFGVRTQAVRSGPGGLYSAAHYEPVISTMEDVEKIQAPRLGINEEATARNLERAHGVFEGILPVERGGVRRHYFAPWDRLVMWTGMDTLFCDMVDRPEFVHAAISRFTEALIIEVKQLEELDALARNDAGVNAGTGGPGWTDELPADDFAGRVRIRDMWANSMAQVFSGISPAMHEDFALQYEAKYLALFGLNYYGCCEPLERKVDICRKHIPRLRKISMSPYVDHERGAEAVGRGLVYSAKPNPAVLAADTWQPEHARRDIRDILQKTRGLHVEIVMKDISTVRGEPHRLDEWARIVMEEVEQFPL